MAKAMGIDQANVMTQMTPESKSDFVEKLLKDDGVIFVGDGLNDSLAMSKASVAISAYTSVDASYKTSDVHLLKHGVSDVVDLINISNKTIDVIKINLSASLVYNVIFGGLALTGFINPLVAAFLMPISSFSVIGHSIFRLRG